MNYISVKEAAQRWGVSVRLAQQLCSSGRVPGAVKFGGSWAVPDGADKPGDPRRPTPAARPSSAPPEPMPLLNSCYLPGQALEHINAIESPESRDLALAEYRYFSGQSEKAAALAAPYLEAESLPLKLSACWIYGYANLALDRIGESRRALSLIRRTVEQLPPDAPKKDRALAQSILAGANVLLHLPLPEGLEIEKGVRLLPPGLRLFILYVQAHYAYLHGSYGSSIGIAETALVLEEERYPLPAIYLHLVACMDHVALKHMEAGRRHLLAAWELARPDQLIGPFAEHHGLLGASLEAILKKDWPEEFRQIIALTYKFSAGWRKIHNPDSGDQVADNLSTTEFAVAMLAARGWSNKEIAEHMGISANTVKSHVAVALQKLGISHRKELKSYLLR